MEGRAKFLWNGGIARKCSLQKDGFHRNIIPGGGNIKGEWISGNTGYIVNKLNTFSLFPRRYQVSVYTGHVFGAGTTAKVRF